MKIEINLWVNPTSINGAINVNVGARHLKFTRLIPYNKFIDEGIRKKFATDEEFQELTNTLNLDTQAQYAWLSGMGEFVYWNQNKDIAYTFLGNEIYSIPKNALYRTGMYPNQPHLSFRL